MKRILLLLAASGFLLSCYGQLGVANKKFTRQDSLRGSLTPERTWWDVLHYDVDVTPDFGAKTITGFTTIRYKVVSGQAASRMQIDLQEPLVIDSFYYDGKFYITDPANPPRREGNVYYLPLPRAAQGSEHTVGIRYHGKPREAVNAPWDGGWIWKKDRKGRPWMSVACQGLGASVWYPCKDHQSDEPDQGATLRITAPANLKAIGNGRLKATLPGDNYNTWVWEVTAPINNYTIIPYIGYYEHFGDTLIGEKGKLDLDYWVLDYEIEKAKKQFTQVKPMMRAFEHWFGAYPFYEDGFKLVQSPHLGMEHQSAVAYGNGFQNGYLGQDLSGTGWGLKWDYIIVHEAGHEWFANNITTKDIADMWVHEGFTDYSETLFTEYHYGRKAGDEYLQGLRGNIENDRPIIGRYGVNEEGSGDMYFKGANLIHTIRAVINNDEKFRSILRGLNQDFYRKTVTTKEVEDYISQKSGIDFSKVFDQYLRTTKIPAFEVKDGQYRWSNVVPGFNMPLQLANGYWLMPTMAWKKLPANVKSTEVNKNFYINTK